MNQTLYSRVRIRAVLLFIGGTALAGAATAQSGDREPADRDALNADGLVGLGDAPRLAGRDRFLSRVTPMIAERDANGDGSMSFAEFSEPPLSKFSLMDEDGDGQVNLDAIVDAANAGSASEDT